STCTGGLVPILRMRFNQQWAKKLIKINLIFLILSLKKIRRIYSVLISQSNFGPLLIKPHTQNWHQTSCTG
ncbi:hypothetical protein, partial [Escherichia coli]|uniref:hypothetical protein n=1 Tax=Escherichia coli TaxID=562 RepID=UPI001BFC1C9A